MQHSANMLKLHLEVHRVHVFFERLQKKLTISFSPLFFYYSIVHRPFAPIRGYHRCSAQAEAACTGTKLLLYGKLYLFLPPPPLRVARNTG